VADENEPTPEIGLTGARFRGAHNGSRKRRARGAVPDVAESEAAEGDEWPAVGAPGARFDGAARRRRARGERAPGPEAMSPESTGLPPAQPGAAGPVPALVPTEQAEPAIQVPAAFRVRPYVITGGRTRAQIELALETLVSAGPRPTTEHHAVVELCRRPISVAEVAALTRLPIGVARVVVGDLATAGALVVHANGVRDVPDVAFLQRVLTGLRGL